MGRDKKKDNDYLDCDNVHELAYIATLYGDKQYEVVRFLLDNCETGRINSVIHIEIYELIEKELGFPIPG